MLILQHKTEEILIKNEDWSPKFATGLNMIIGCSSKSISMSDQAIVLPKWFSCKGNILVLEQFDHYSLLSFLAQSQILVISRYISDACSG